MSTLLNNIKGDKVIWAVVFLLTIVSFLAVYSSTGTLAYKYHGGNTEYYMLKHAIILFFGLLLMYFAHLIKYTYYSRIFQIALYIAVPLLVVTLIIGLNLNEAQRVLQLPFGLTFQTSDLAKITLIIYLARMLSKKQDQIKDFKTTFVPLMLPVIIVTGLILPENFSTAALLFTTSLVLIFIGRVKISYLLGMIGIGVVFLAIAIGILSLMPPDKQGRLGTWKNRITAFVEKDGEPSYQTEQAKIAIATGGVVGKMPGNSTQRNFLPHPYSDFIFAIIIEEYGILGGVFLVLLYLILLFRAVKIVTQSPGTFGAFLTIGVAFSLVFQAMINMGVAVDLLPVTGQPLPLVSMGGTSIWFTSLSIGIILSAGFDYDEATTFDHDDASLSRASKVTPARRPSPLSGSRIGETKHASAKAFVAGRSPVSRNPMLDPNAAGVSPSLFEDSGAAASQFQPHVSDETLLEDVDRFMIAMQPIKECQQQVRELRYDNARSKEELTKEAWFWRRHEAKWKTRLPFHSGDITYGADTHFA